MWVIKTEPPDRPITLTRFCFPTSGGIGLRKYSMLVLGGYRGVILDGRSTPNTLIVLRFKYEPSTRSRTLQKLNVVVVDGGGQMTF